MDINIFIYLILLAAPVGNGLHEIGHVLGAKLVNADKITITIGSGPVIFRTVWKQTDISIGVIYFLGGMAGSQRKTPYQPGELITIAVLGPLSSFTVAFLCYGIYMMNPGNYLLVLLLFNLWLGLINIIPFRIKGKESDGYTIFKVIKNKQ